MLLKDKKIHFIGIGGIGMSALAQYCLKQGARVSGSDAKENFLVSKLKGLGAEISIGHRDDESEGADLVIVSSAIDPESGTLKFIRKNKIKWMKRGDFLAEMTKSGHNIIVSGSHGKTTTSSLIGSALYKNNQEVNVIIGGRLVEFDTNYLYSPSDAFVIESDESDGSFLKLSPSILVVTNVDNDHLAHYGSLENLKNAFEEFISNASKTAKVVLNIDDPFLKILKEKYQTYSFSLDQESDFMLLGSKKLQQGYTLDVRALGEKLTIKTILLGEYNFSNLIGALSALVLRGMPYEKVEESLSDFNGVRRRIEKIKSSKNILLYDDYAHHPHAIRSVIKAVKEHYDNYELNVIFQPHRYTRTRDLFDEFVTCFDEVDKVYIAPIYTAGEKEISGVTSEALVEKLSQRGGKAELICLNAPPLEALENASSNKIFLCLGAGDIGEHAKKWIN